MANTSINNDRQFTIVMYPWFAMGHLTPYLVTANQFAQRGHKIIFIIPPKAQSRLAPLNLHPGLIRFRPISIPHYQGLPAHVETTNDVTIQDQHLLRRALNLTQPEIESLLCDLKPDFIFFDLMHWVPGLARRLQIKSVHYSVVSPASMGFLFAEDPGFPSIIKLYTHTSRALKYFETMKDFDSDITKKQRMVTAICESDAIGFRTCQEIEGPYCLFLENKLKKPILLAGPMVPKPESTSLDEMWANWLGKFKPETVIFCCFGTEAVLTKDQFDELLLGFEMTNFPFLIALRPPEGFDTLEEAMPKGFKERTKERGIVRSGWVPQNLILKHPSVGSFVTHCGYGSMWEGLMSHCRLVVLPNVADQYIHARLLSAYLRVAVEVEKGDEDGLFAKDGVFEAIEAAMADQTGIGKEVKENHDKWYKLLLSEGFQDACFNNFVDNLCTLIE
ncbi:hypothetical protein CASFOL_014292 [Castilleja foliolosa]|uniref:Glycosyltransferase n=1 Tax=Castilleja foliolosa TaxID=1961234 RepID=A0ABD3DPC6_9LAMI